MNSFYFKASGANVFSILAIFFCICISSSLSFASDLFECSDEIAKEEKCRGDNCKLVILYRDCGATTSTSTIVELRNIGLFNRSKIIFTANKKLDINLLFANKNELTLQFNESFDVLSKNIFIKESKVKNIIVNYEFLENDQKSRGQRP